jgi:hypothetical protein
MHDFGIWLKLSNWNMHVCALNAVFFLIFFFHTCLYVVSKTLLISKVKQYHWSVLTPPLIRLAELSLYSLCVFLHDNYYKSKAWTIMYLFHSGWGFFQTVAGNLGVVLFQVLALKGSYHGDTLGAMEAQAPSSYTGFLQQPW